MKNNIFKKVALACVGAMMMFPSCEDFLDRPTEDNPSCKDFYKSEEELQQAVNPLYCIAWFDFQRMWLDAGDNLAGNWGKGDQNIYTTLNMSNSGSDATLTNGSGALNAVVSFANIAMRNFTDFSTAAPEVVNKYKGECMLFKALAYFYMVRIWGETPIIDDNVDIIQGGQSYELYKNSEEDLYQYIILNLLKAEEYLPEENSVGRVDKASAWGLLSKVYLYYACMKDRDPKLLQKSIDYAEKVRKSGNHSELEPVYGKLFRAEGQKSPEKLIALYWSPSYDPYPSININHCDLGPNGLNETGAWGQWNYVTLDLVGLFGQKTMDPTIEYGAANLRPDSFRDDKLTVAEGYDTRRAATMCMYHDYIPFWQRDKANGAPNNMKGFYCTYNLHKYDEKNEADKENETVAEWVYPSGAAPVKQIHGSIYDHEQEYGCTPSGQGSCTPMILLRTADVYLCAGEAAYHLGDVAKAKEYIDIVRNRAGVGDQEYSLDMKFIIDERRRELAFEGDNYYDFRRWSYFDVAGAKAYILGQERNPLACGYFDGKNGDFPATFKNPGANANDPSDKIKLSVIPTNAKGEPFLLMYPAQDLISNPKLNEPAVPYDFEAAGYDKSKI